MSFTGLLRLVLLLLGLVYFYFFFKIDTIVLLFVFDKYYLIID